MKSTKKSLIASALSLVLCISMLLGTTYAWFTDSVTSGKNQIIAGNLDVELYHGKTLPIAQIEANSVKDATELFGVSLWEPGVVAYENFTVANVGNLALKYALNLNVFDKNKTAAGHDLTEVIKVAVVNGGFTGDRAEAQALSFDTLADFQKTGNLAAKNDGDDDETTYGVVLYWQPTDHDNDYNVNNYTGTRPTSDGQPLFVEFGVNLVATQDTVEADSFDVQYDKLAEFPVTAEAKVEAGKATKLTAYDGNNTLAAKAEIPADDTTVADGSKIKMVVTETNKPEGITVTEDQDTLNLDVKFFEVKGSGEETPITEFQSIVSVDLSAVLPDGAKVDNVYHTHDGVSTPMDKADSANAVTDGKFFFEKTTNMLTIGSKTFSPFTLVYSLANTDYGFADSYQEDGHWVHEITNAEEFRNIMDATEHTNKHGQYDYPGAGAKETVYLIRNDIDFGGKIYTAEQIELVKQKYFTGTLTGDGNVTLSNVHLTETMGTGISSNKAIWGLFDGVINANFKNLTLSGFVIDNPEGKICGFLAAGQEGQNKDGAVDVNAYLIVRNVVIDESCSINAAGNAAAMFGITRNFKDIVIEDCTNNADVTVTGTGGAGFIGQASTPLFYTAKPAENSMTVRNCVNNGDISGGGDHFGSFTGYQMYNTVYTNYTNNGDLYYTSTSGSSRVGIAIGRTASGTLTYNNVVNNGVIYYSCTSIPLNDSENKSADTQIWYTDASSGTLVSGFNGTNAPTDAYKTVAFVSNDVTKLTLGFDENGLLTVSGGDGLTNAAKITVSVTTGAHTSESDGTVKNSKSTGSFPVDYFEIVSNSGTLQELVDYGFKKVNQVGYLPPVGVTPTFDQNDWGRITAYVHDYELDAALYGQPGYTDADLGYGMNEKGGYILIRNITPTGFTVITPLHQSPRFIIRVYDTDGKLIALGDINSGYAAGEHIPTDIHVTAGIDKYVYISES